MTDGSAKTAARRPTPRRIQLTLRALASALLVGLLVLWYALESDTAADRLRQFLEARATAAVGSPVHISSLEIDVLPFHLVATDIWVDAPAATATSGPERLAEVERLVLDLSPWGLAQNRITIANLELEQPHLRLDLPLPDGERGGGSLPFQLDLRRLRIRNGELRTAHRTARFDGELLGLGLQLAPEASGLMAAAAEARVGELRVAGGRLDLSERDGFPAVLEPLEIDAVFGVRSGNLELDQLRLRAGASRLTLTGAIRSFDSADLQLEGDLAVADIFKVWVPPGAQDHSGRATFLGTVQVRNGEPVLAGRLSSTESRAAGLPLQGFASDLQILAERVTLRNLRTRLFGGTLNGNIDVDRTRSPGFVQIDYEADNVDAAALTRWEAAQGWRLAGRLGGSGSIGWSRPFRSNATGAGRLRLELPDVASRGVAGNLTTPASRAGVTDDPDQPRRAHTVPALPLPASAEIGYRLTGGTLVLENSTLDVAGTSISANGRLGADGALAAGLRLQSDDLRMLDHLVAQYRSFRGSDHEPRRFGLRGAGTLDLQVGGTLDAPVLSGSVEARQLAVADLAIGDARATLSSEDGALLTRDLVILRSGGAAAGSARVRVGPAPTTRADSAVVVGDAVVAGGDYDLTLRLDSYGLEAEPTVRGARRRIRASTSGALHVSGSYGGPPEATFDLTGERVSLDRLELSRAAMRGSWASETLRLDSIEGTGLGGVFGGQITWARDSDRISTAVSAREIDLAELVAALGDSARGAATLGGRLDTTLNLDGPLQALDGEATLRWSDARWGDLPLGVVGGAVRATSGILSARALGSLAPDSALTLPDVPPASVSGFAPTALPAPEGGWSFAATLGNGRPWPLALRLQSPASVVAGFLEQLGQPMPAGTVIGGQLTAQGSGDLANLDNWRGNAEVSGLRLEQAPDILAVAERFHAEIDAGLLTADIRLDTGSGPMDLAGTVDLAARQVNATVSGTLDLRLARLWKPEMTAGGTVQADLRANGDLDDPLLDGTLRLRGASLDNGWMYPVTAAEADLRLEGRSLHLTRLDGRMGTEPFSGDGTIPLSALLGSPEVDTGAATSSDLAELRIRVDGLPIDPVIARSDALSALISGGALSGELRVHGAGLNWRTYDGQLEVSALQVRMRDYSLDLAAPMTVAVDSGALLIPATNRVVGARTDLAVAGLVELSPLRLDLQVGGQLGLEPLNVLSPVWGTGGVAGIESLRVFGDVSDLAFRGSAELRDVVLSPPPLRQPISGIQANVVLEDRRIRIESAEGDLGGGKVTATSEIFLRENRPQSFRTVANVESSLLRLERDVRVRASADLVHDGTPERSLLSGTVRLIEGRYRRELLADDALLEILEAPETDPDPLLQSIALGLRVSGDSGLFIDNNLADVEVTADFDVRGTVALPIVLGRSVLLSGRMFWNGNTFDVLQGTVQLNNPFETEPTFEIRSRTEIRRYTIDMNFSGSFQRGISFDYSSTPTLSDLDLFNLLAFGEEPDSAVLQDPYRYQRALGLQATRYLTDAYLSEVERGAERLFGVDRFRIAPTLTGSATDATARLTIGKRINRNLYVTYSRLLNTSEDQLLTVEYQLTPEIRLKGTRDEDGSFGVDFLVQKRIR